MIGRICLILASSLFIEYLVSAAFLGGGDTGNSNVPSVSGTPNTSKLIAGIDCTRENSTSPLLEASIYIKENDTMFNNTDGLLKGTTLEYTCLLMNVTAWKAGVKQRMTAPGCNLTRLDSNFSTITPTDNDERTHYSNFSFDSIAGPVPCGGEQNGNEASFIVLCVRDENFQKAFDAAFMMTCNNSTATVRTLDTNAGVGSPPVINTTYAANVTASFYVYDNVSVTNISDDTMRVDTTLDGVSWVPAGGVALGAVVRIELCLYIDTSRGDTRWYFQDNVGPSGISVEGLTVSNVESDNPISPGFINSVSVLDANGCSLNADPTALGQERQGFMYLQPNGADTTKYYLISPNCFLSRWFEVASFVTQNRATSTLNFTLELSYCTTWALDGNGVNKCFGNVSSTDDTMDGYSNCSGVGVNAGRRRRSVAEEFNLPTTFSTSLTIINPNFVEEPEEPVDEEVTQECFEKETFTILTACLAFLLAIVLLMAVFLACRIQSARSASLKGSSSSGYTSGYATSGYSNKGFKSY